MTTSIQRRGVAVFVKFILRQIHIEKFINSLSIVGYTGNISQVIYEYYYHSIDNHRYVYPRQQIVFICYYF